MAPREKHLRGFAAPSSLEETIIRPVSQAKERPMTALVFAGTGAR